MISNGAKALIVAAIDGGTLGNVLATAKEAGIPVIAYDRLLMDTDAVSYYTTFDLVMVGTIQGTYLKDRFKLDTEAGPFTIEFTAGDPADNNARYFFQGAMDVLKPYLDSGKLVCKSGQTTFEACATPKWTAEVAQARMDTILSTNYSDALTGGTKLDMVMCSNDSTAQGVTNSLVYAGYTKDNIPAITGQDCDITSTKNMVKGLQAMSVFKDTRTLAEETTKMIVEIVAGKVPTTNSSYNNNVIDVPTFLCTPVFADINNYKTLLVEGGYYTEAELAN